MALPFGPAMSELDAYAPLWQRLNFNRPTYGNPMSLNIPQLPAAPNVSAPAVPDLAALQIARQMFGPGATGMLPRPAARAKSRRPMAMTEIPERFIDLTGTQPLFSRPGPQAAGMQAGLPEMLGYSANGPSPNRGAAQLQGLLATMQRGTSDMMNRAAARTKARQSAADFVKRQADLGVAADPAALVRMGLDPQTARLMSEASSTRLGNEGSVGRFLGPGDMIKRGGGYVTAFGDAAPFKRNLSRDPLNNPEIWQAMNAQNASPQNQAWTVPQETADRAAALEGNWNRNTNGTPLGQSLAGTADFKNRYINPERGDMTAAAMRNVEAMRNIWAAANERKRKREGGRTSRVAAAKTKIPAGNATSAMLSSLVGALGGWFGF